MFVFLLPHWKKIDHVGRSGAKWRSKRKGGEEWGFLSSPIVLIY